MRTSVYRVLTRTRKENIGIQWGENILKWVRLNRDNITNIYTIKDNDGIVAFYVGVRTRHNRSRLSM